MSDYLSAGDQIKTGQARMLAGLLVFLIIIAGGWYLILPPVLQFVKGGDYYLPAWRAEYEQREKNLQAMKELISGSQKVSRVQQDKLAMLLPAGEDRAGLFAQLEELVLNSGLIPLEMAIKKESDGAGPPGTAADEANQEIKHLYVSLRLGSARYDNFKKLLDSLEKNLRLMEVVELNFEPKSNAASLTLITYYLGEN